MQSVRFRDILLKCSKRVCIRGHPTLVRGEAHHARTLGRASHPRWLSIPQRGLYTRSLQPTSTYLNTAVRGPHESMRPLEQSCAACKFVASDLSRDPRRARKQAPVGAGSGSDHRWKNTCASERSEASHATGASRRSGERGRVWGSLSGASPQIKFGGADETRTRDLRRDRLAPTSPERSRLRKIGVGCPRAWSLTADCGRVFWNALQVLASEIHKHRGREPGHLPASSRRRQTSAVVFRRQASQSSSLRKREHPDSGDSKPADLPKSARHFPRRRCSDSRTVNR
jgi:hypothetical protein